MKHKVIKVAIICLSLMIASAGGYLASLIWLNHISNDTSSYNAEVIDENEMTIITSSALYPEFSFQEMVSHELATYIVDATVTSVGDTYMEYLIYDEEREPTYPITPVQLDVHSSLKNDTSLESVAFLEEGGAMANQIKKPVPYTMYEGMDVVLFINPHGYLFNPAAFFLVSNGNVVLNKVALEYIDPSKVTSMSVEELEADVEELLKSDNVSAISVMPKEAFLAEISAILVESSQAQ
jgi:hypothetical protein